MAKTKSDSMIIIVVIVLIVITILVGILAYNHLKKEHPHTTHVTEKYNSDEKDMDKDIDKPWERPESDKEKIHHMPKPDEKDMDKDIDKPWERPESDKEKMHHGAKNSLNENHTTKGISNDAEKVEAMLKKKGWLLSAKQHILGENQPIKPGDIVQCPGGVCPGLGKGFYLSKLNLTDPSAFLEGSDMFKKATDNCVAHRKGQKNIKNIMTTENTEDLISNISSENNIQGSVSIQAVSVKPTLNFITGSNITKHKNIKTSKISLSNEEDVFTFINNNSCRRDNINSEFIEDFKGLPVKIDNAYNSAVWRPFLYFFNKWGSHVMTQVTYGSKFEYYESSIDDDSVNGKTLEAKLCADLEGALTSITSAGLCSKFHKDSKEEVKDIKTNKKIIIVGGTDETRHAFINTGLTAENVENFLKSSNNSNQPIGYHFTPIWQIYQQVNIGKSCISNMVSGSSDSEDCRDLQRCLNLEAAYAYDALDCKQEKTENGVVYQEFKKEDAISDITTYKCWVAKEGCNSSKSDCHMGIGGCKAYGPSALEREDVKGFSGFKMEVRGDSKGGSHDGINSSCSFNGIECKCNKLWSGGLRSRTLWDQGDSI